MLPSQLEKSGIIQDHLRLATKDLIPSRDMHVSSKMSMFSAAHQG
jgi:hypothetical protein